jgi:hypothetical protein
MFESYGILARAYEGAAGVPRALNLASFFECVGGRDPPSQSSDLHHVHRAPELHHQDVVPAAEAVCPEWGVDSRVLFGEVASPILGQFCGLASCRSSIDAREVLGGVLMALILGGLLYGAVITRTRGFRFSSLLSSSVSMDICSILFDERR